MDAAWDALADQLLPPTTPVDYAARNRAAMQARRARRFNVAAAFQQLQRLIHDIVEAGPTTRMERTMVMSTHALNSLEWHVFWLHVTTTFGDLPALPLQCRFGLHRIRRMLRSRRLIAHLVRAARQSWF